MSEEPNWHKEYESKIVKTSHRVDGEFGEPPTQVMEEHSEGARYQYWVGVKDEAGETHWGYSNVRVSRTDEEFADARREALARGARASGKTTDEISELVVQKEGLFVYEGGA